MADIISYVIWGLIAGIASGFFGIGGGIILVPVLAFIYGLTQHQAQGTTLALMVPPIGLLAVLRYYRSGSVNVKMAAFICLGFFLGGYLGAEIAHHIPDDILRRLFGMILLFVSLKLILLK